MDIQSFQEYVESKQLIALLISTENLVIYSIEFSRFSLSSKMSPADRNVNGDSGKGERNIGGKDMVDKAGRGKSKGGKAKGGKFKGGKVKGKSISRSKRAGIEFPVGRLERYLRKRIHYYINFSLNAPHSAQGPARCG